MPSRDEYTDTLISLVKLLRRKPMTARQVAEALGCSKVTAYDRIHELEKRGFGVYRYAAREGRVGPKATAFGVI